jgi:acyl-CoA reductase-like NAD-dependent aldehyde dehydrogenase
MGEAGKKRTADAGAARGYFVGGEFRAHGEPLEVRSPYDGHLAGTTYLTPDREIEEAVGQVVAAFAETAALATDQRAAILRQMAEGVSARRDLLVRLLALEAGKPVKAGRAECERAVFTLRTAAAEAERIAHEFLPLDLLPATRGRWAIVRRFPIGPVLAFTPFNFPVNLALHKLGPAIAAGNPVFLKPSPKTPLTAAVLAEIAVEAGLPPAALAVVNCTNERAARLVEDERFRLLSFTGSAAVGWSLRARAGKKRVALELGGNAAAVVHSDADVDFAAERITVGGFTFAGQSCIAVQRVFVHRAAEMKLTGELVERARALAVGDPLDAATDVGPLITREATERVEAWVKEAVAGGAKLLTGGTRDGNIFHPTVLTGTRPEMRINCEEIFGPVVTVEPFDDFDRALAAVNDSPYGLHAGVFTRDVARAFRAFERLEVGAVVLNDAPTFRADHMPYGGVKDSGAGREGPRYAIEEMTESRTLVLNLGAPPGT